MGAPRPSSALAVPPSPVSSTRHHDGSSRHGSGHELTSMKNLSPGRHSSNRSSTGGSAVSSGASAALSIAMASRPKLSLDMRSSDSRSIDSRSEKRLPSLPSPFSERSSGKGWALGAYDNKLVSSTLSQLPPLPPLSPGGMSASGSAVSSYSSSPHVHGALGSSPNFPMTTNIPPMPRAPNASHMTLSSSSQGVSGSGGAGGVLVLPDGTKLPNPDGGRSDSVHQAISHAGPNSPWSLLTVHVLPVFAGSPLKTPIEDLNSLCNQHIVATSQRAPTARLIGILTSDLREFVASGMLTLKAKFEALEESKVVSRTSEVWNFFWGQILPYVEGVFLPLSQVRDVPLATSTPHQFTPIITMAPIAVRQILLSAFLVHILLPLLPRLVSLVSSPSILTSNDQNRGTDLPRLLQMSLVLSTQARYTAFFPIRNLLDGEARDEETREGVEELSRAVRWAMAVASGAIELPEEEEELTDRGGTEWATPGASQNKSATTPIRPGLQRGPSVSQAGRLRRRGLRSGSISQLEPEPITHHTDHGTMAPEARWGRPRIDEDDEEGDRHSQYYGQMDRRPGGVGTVGTALGSTAQSTVRGAESFATIVDQRTPAALGAPAVDTRRHARHERAMSSGESDLTTASSMFSRRKH